MVLWTRGVRTENRDGGGDDDDDDDDDFVVELADESKGVSGPGVD